MGKRTEWWHIHLGKVWRYGIDVYESRNISMVGEVSEESNFSKGPLRELYLLKDTGDKFYGHCLA